MPHPDLVLAVGYALVFFIGFLTGAAVGYALGFKRGCNRD